jgi:uncharacterized membrane protein
MSGSLRTGVQVFAVLLVGLIAGLMLGTGIEQHSLRALTASAWVTEHQVMDAVFRVVMKPFWNGTVLVLIVAAIVSRGSARWLFGVAALLLIVSLVVTVRVEVPMNQAIAKWDPSAPPANWAEIRERWLMFHRLRTWSGIVAFLCAITGLVKERTEISYLNSQATR